MFKKLLKQANEKGRSFFTECNENWYLLSDEEKKALFVECYLTILDTKKEEIAMENLKEYNVEMFRSFVESDFIYYMEEYGWDDAIEFLEEKINMIEEENLKEELKLKISDYKVAYSYAIDGDIDGGKCYQMREKAIQEILEILERTL